MWSAVFPLAIFLFCLVKTDSFPDPLTVKVSGGIVHGGIDNSTPNVRHFLGIPYGQPPLGNLRFAPPRPAQPFGKLNTTSMPPSCMQFAIGTPTINTRDVLEFNLGGLNGTTGPISEDCLTLSIWTPLHVGAKEKLPVIIFFYGGAFLTGGVDVPYQVPSRWIQRTQNHIVVSFNHRDGIFGYPNAAGLSLTNQNVGLADQRLAVEWVRDNIGVFGGDASRIGLWGQSSGAIAIAYQTATYRKNPIANSAILSSGNEFIDILTHDPKHGNFSFVANHFGCPPSPSEELACMRNVDAHALVSFLREQFENGTQAPLTFSPIVDNITAFAPGQMSPVADIPVLIGSTEQDGNVFVPYNPGGVDESTADALTMEYFFCTAYRAAQARITAGTSGEMGMGRAYRYLYTGNFSNISPRPWMGAWHGSELPLVFGTHGLYRGKSTELEEETSRVMQDVWVEFVATGGKVPSVRGWDELGREGGVVGFGNGAARVVDLQEMEGKC